MGDDLQPDRHDQAPHFINPRIQRKIDKLGGRMEKLLEQKRRTDEKRAAVYARIKKTEERGRRAWSDRATRKLYQHEGQLLERYNILDAKSKELASKLDASGRQIGDLQELGSVSKAGGGCCAIALAVPALAVAFIIFRLL